MNIVLRVIVDVLLHKDQFRQKKNAQTNSEVKNIILDKRFHDFIYLIKHVIN